jgi:hypothetical protein
VKNSAPKSLAIRREILPCQYSQPTRGALLYNQEDFAPLSLRGASLLLLSTISAHAQVSLAPIEGDRVAAAEDVFARAAAEPSMKCTFSPSAPVLNFNLRYDAAYSLNFSVDPARWQSQWIDTLVRLQHNQANAKPLYMAGRYLLPPMLETRQQAVLTAQFPLSAGVWRIEALAIDDQGRACHASWRADLKDPAPVPSVHPSRSRRIAVFVDSEPIRLPSGQFAILDTETLTGSLSALLRSMPAESARVVVFNLDLERELYRSGAFQPTDLDNVAQAIQATNAALVNYASLRQPQSALDFLAALIHRELDETKPSDIVVFLGAAGRSIHVPRKIFTADGPHALFLHIQYSVPRYTGGVTRNLPTRTICNDGDVTGGSCIVVPSDRFNPKLRLTPVAVRDAIGEAIAILGGHTIPVSTPLEFAQALTRNAAGAARR